MSLSVYKYQLYADGICLNLPVGAQVLTAAAQGDDIVLWALVDTTEGVPKEMRQFVVYGTGHKIDLEQDKLKYVSTAFLGPLVFHVFEALGEQS